MRLDDETYEFIKGEASNLFEQYEINCIPISGMELAIKMGFQLVPYSSLNEVQRKLALKASDDGFYYEPGDGTERIYFNDEKSYERINMTIIHEIGHAVLGHTEDTPVEIAEAEAGFFAKYVLAPPALVHRIQPDNPFDIADVFCISYMAACNAFNYYKKWHSHYMRFGKYTDYEEKMLRLYA